MSRPRVVGEAKRVPARVAPPAHSGVRAHEWLSPGSRASHDERLSSGVPFDMYLSSSAEFAIREQADAAASERLEVMGFLLGDVRMWEGETYTVVLEVGTTDLESTNAKVRFERDALPKLFAALDRSSFDYVIVGWYHSHPGHTCFLSRIDLRTQRAIFDQPYHTALVVDPLSREIKTFKLSDDGYVECAFTVFDARAPRRTRRLKNASSAPGDPTP